MTLIVDPKNFTSKAKLQESLNAGNCVVHEPSIMGEWTKLAKDLPVGLSGVVTNHPCGRSSPRSSARPTAGR